MGGIKSCEISGILLIYCYLRFDWSGTLWVRARCRLGPNLFDPCVVRV